MKLYYAQTTAQNGSQEICITEQFYEYLKTKNIKYQNGDISISYTEFKERQIQNELQS